MTSSVLEAVVARPKPGRSSLLAIFESDLDVDAGRAVGLAVARTC